MKAHQVVVASIEEFKKTVSTKKKKTETEREIKKKGRRRE